MPWLGCNAKAADKAWERAAIHARAAGVTSELAEILTWRASCAFSGSLPAVEAIRRCETIREELHGSRREAAWVLRPLAGLQAMTGDFATARDLLEESGAALEELGVAMHHEVPYHEALVEMLAAHPGPAEERLRSSHTALAAAGEKALLSGVELLLAQALLALDRAEEALSFTELAEESGGRADLGAQIGWRTVRARVLARAGRLEEAEGLAREAVRLAERTDFLNEHGDAQFALGDVLSAAGRQERAAEAFEEALGLYERKGNLVRMRTARSALASLARV